ncbi:hypothetical protein CV093_20245 [Oceanobacillus sp. 143]|uniref:Uncharacterized protein n=1 Tax=Oceanobacillus zhaokaii TaxID=2052660 RepID=A0A345PLG4_9BACI|nr:hypothetical protein [Oceanobacillus zhaokaii]AXI10844.1 hypothetical protein CUC15_18765 [Oceanobacillus zhaokaii]QGS69724.1 hypothetical protein CV093_20245 [Oceanobacillus sp. 143]
MIVDVVIIDAVIVDAVIVDALIADALIVDALIVDALIVDALIVDAVIVDAEDSLMWMMSLSAQMKLFLKTIVDDVAVDIGTTGKTSVLACREYASLQAFSLLRPAIEKMGT